VCRVTRDPENTLKLGVVALDFDDTAARDGVLDPQVREVIHDLRERGVVVILVTGRILSDLAAHVGSLDFFDAVVAENGAVLSLPAAGHDVPLAAPPPRAFLDELARRRIDVTVGECVVEAWATFAEPIVAVIRALELPLVVLFNQGRLMVLPQGVSKATGLHAALRLLRVSEHNALGIGNGENDHALLQACGIGAAVAWGSARLRDAADAVVPGVSPTDVATYLRSLLKTLRLPSPDTVRRKVSLGTYEGGSPATLEVRGRNVLVAGESQSGKSWIAGMLCEQLILQGYSVCVLDVEGDHQALHNLPGVIHLRGGPGPPSFREVTLALRHPDLSVVVDLSELSQDRKKAYVHNLLEQLAILRRRTGLPHRIVIEEAHQFLDNAEAAALLDPNLEGYTLVTYRPSALHPSVLQNRPVLVATRLSDPDEIDALRRYRLAANPDPLEEQLEGLALGEALVLSDDADRGHSPPRTIHLGKRLTTHVRHRVKYGDVAVPLGKAFVFTRHGAPTGSIARTMRDFARSVAQTDSTVLRGHLRRGDFSRWVRDVFVDHRLAQQLGQLEQIHQYEDLAEIRQAIVRLIEARYLAS
jgi:hydroxymethylpyrimidine pyrophosphatase-like HAD family hydrolase